MSFRCITVLQKCGFPGLCCDVFPPHCTSIGVCWGHHQPGYRTGMAYIPSPPFSVRAHRLRDEPLHFLEHFSERTIHSPAAGPQPWIWSSIWAKFSPWAWPNMITQCLQWQSCPLSWEHNLAVKADTNPDAKSFLCSLLSQKEFQPPLQLLFLSNNNNTSVVFTKKLISAQNRCLK